MNPFFRRGLGLDTSSPATLKTQVEFQTRSAPQQQCPLNAPRQVLLGSSPAAARPGCFPLQQLCLAASKQCWSLQLDIYILNADGAVLDAVLLAAVAALSGELGARLCAGTEFLTMLGGVLRLMPGPARSLMWPVSIAVQGVCELAKADVQRVYLKDFAEPGSAWPVTLAHPFSVSLLSRWKVQELKASEDG